MKMKVTASGLNLRATAGPNGRVLRVLPHDAKVEQISRIGSWAYVRDDASGAQGYVAVVFLEPVSSWRLAASLKRLGEQVDAAYPKRSKAYDGTIGDDAHAARKSDHNPNAQGVVTARDITHDPEHGFDAAKFAEALRLSKDVRLKYVIHSGRMFSSKVQPWVWRPYKGADPHRHHVHVSVDADPQLYDDDRPWKLA